MNPTPPTERNLRRTSIGLRFLDPVVEAEYVQYHLQRAAPFVRVGAAGIALAWLNSTITITMLRREYLVPWLVALFLLQVPFLILMEFSARNPSRYRLLLPSSLATLVIGTIMALGLSTWVYRDQGTAIGAMLICAYFLPLLRFPTRLAALEGVLVGLIYLPFLAYGDAYHGLSGAQEIQYAALWTTGTAVALGMAYVMDVDGRRAFVAAQKLEWQRALVAVEKARAESLLLNILPGPIAERLKGGDLVIADAVTDVTVLFLDVVGFTTFAQGRSATEVVAILSEVFTAFDGLARKHGVEKIKTIGDAYMAVAGLPVARPDHAQAAAGLALDMRDWMATARPGGESLQVRVGLYSGGVVAGVIGISKFAYDLWGDTVNSAARMESHGLAGEVQIGETTRALLGDAWPCEDRGIIEVKGKGPMRVFLLKGCPDPIAPPA